MTVSFKTVLINLKTQLETDVKLNTFCTEKWRRQLDVKIAAHKRCEINSSQLPIILITRPETANNFYRHSHGAEHQIRLYAGFYQKEKDMAVLEQIEFEEKIIDAVMSDRSFGDVASELKIGGTANDEGRGHPTYFTVISLTVGFERDFADESDFDDFNSTRVDIDMHPSDSEIDSSDIIIMEK